ncbi:low temperature requirement protein A [Streptomyces sp. LaPpAH-108]|uniref:low temperature requirement protein A n=1 Tax=Streptomyces sp. LaPpAH-108 TaxID=1155714 RepID=UPI0003A09F7C|nr:low temperature requirement protein A [Streptomyces sp. LaPpAH-108]
MYFGGGEDVFRTAVATTANPLRSVRMAVNSAYVVLAALVAMAVGSELVVAHPLGHGSVTLALLLFGGLALYLAATAWFFRATAHGAWTERLLAGAACVPAAVATVWIPPLAAVALLDLILLLTVTSLTRAHRRVIGSLRQATDG